jgi:hypothetical protein
MKRKSAILFLVILLFGIWPTSEKEFPDVIDYKFKLAKVYFEYGEYGKAEKYFKEVVASPMMLPIQQIYAHARNDLTSGSKIFSISIRNTILHTSQMLGRL